LRAEPTGACSSLGPVLRGRYEHAPGIGVTRKCPRGWNLSQPAKVPKSASMADGAAVWTPTGPPRRRLLCPVDGLRQHRCHPARLRPGLFQRGRSSFPTAVRWSASTARAPRPDAPGCVPAQTGLQESRSCASRTLLRQAGSNPLQSLLPGLGRAMPAAVYADGNARIPHIGLRAGRDRSGQRAADRADLVG
jgi:hypothetical protein